MALGVGENVYACRDFIQVFFVGFDGFSRDFSSFFFFFFFVGILLEFSIDLYTETEVCHQEDSVR